MKRIILTLMVVCLLALGGQSFAELCTIDAVPAASLLLPAFKTDISDSDGDGTADCAGIDTLFSINNASAAPALAHVTLWTDWSWPSIDFDVFLTGYDVQSVSLCQVIGRGVLPVTADEARDPSDTISPHGGVNSDNPAWDGTFPGCEGPPPFFPFPVPALSPSLLNRVQNAHAGFEVPGLGGCTGEGLNGAGSCSGGSCPVGTIARGYVTVDNVSQCSTVFPNEVGYWVQGGNGIANNINQLWGDYFKVDPVNDFAQGDTLIHVEADASLGTGFGGPNSATGYTFYGRYFTALGGFTGADNREPLGTTWGARYLNGGAFDGGTKYTAWRDSTDDLVGTGSSYACGLCVEGAGPDWCPLNETQVVCWDEAEDAVELCFIFGGGVISPPEDPSDPVCFPLESNHIDVGVDPLDPPWDFGWCFVNLNHTCTVCFPGGAPWPPGGDGIAQSWMGVTHDALGRFSVGYSAIELTHACTTSNPIIDGDLGQP
jgi:hypothetical protein